MTDAPLDASTVSASTPVVLSWSGGKDSAWALHVLRQDSTVEVVALVSTVTEGFERVAMHGIRRDVLHAQATAAGLPVIEALLPQRASNDTYEAVFAGSLAEARSQWPQVRHIAFGDLFLADIKAYREALCARLDWTPLFPLFGAGTDQLAQEMFAGGLRATLCCVDTTQLDVGYAGRAFAPDLFDDLPASCDRCGEHGEFHTCVTGGPMFTGAIPIETGDTVLREERFAYTDLLLPATSAEAR